MRYLALALFLLIAPWSLGAAAAESHGERQKRAYDSLVSGDSLSALTLYRELAEERPNDAEAQYELGVAYGTFNFNEQAIAPLQRALRLRPTHLHAYQVLAIVLGFTGDRAGALAANVAAAELGSVTDMYEVAMMHLLGVGVAPGAETGLAWLRRAALHGHLGAMQKLAELHAGGVRGAPRDMALAQHWLHQLDAAEAELDRQLAGR